MAKANWFEGATYVYHAVPNGQGKVIIDFHIPNASGGKLNLKWSDWLYEYKDGKKVATNLTAELLQCYIDREYDK